MQVVNLHPVLDDPVAPLVSLAVGRAALDAADQPDREAELLSEQIPYIGCPAIINEKSALEIKGLSIVTTARISNIAGLVYSIYQHETSLPSAGLN